MTYVSPQLVVAPQDRWRLSRIIFDGGEGNASIAVGEWKNLEGQWDRCLAMRWNGWDGREKGNPISTGHPTWFIVPGWLSEAVLVALAKQIAAEISPQAGEDKPDQRIVLIKPTAPTGTDSDHRAGAWADLLAHLDTVQPMCLGKFNRDELYDRD